MGATIGDVIAPFGASAIVGASAAVGSTIAGGGAAADATLANCTLGTVAGCSTVVPTAAFGRPPSAKWGRTFSHQYQTTASTKNAASAAIPARTRGDASSPPGADMAIFCCVGTTTRDALTMPALSWVFSNSASTSAGSSDSVLA